MPPHKIRFAFFWTAGISLFHHKINIFNVTETIVSRETKAIAVCVSQRSERRHIEKTLVFWKLSRQKRVAQNKANVGQRSEIHPIIIIPFIREPRSVNRKVPTYSKEN